MNIAEYVIVSGATVATVESEVETLLRKGWQPLGSLQAVGLIEAVGPIREDRPIFLQVMVIYEY